MEPRGAGLPSKYGQTDLEKIAKRVVECRESFTEEEFSLLDSDSDLDRLDLEKGIQNDPETFES